MKTPMSFMFFIELYSTGSFHGTENNMKKLVCLLYVSFRDST